MLDKSFQEITSNIKNAITRTQLEIMTDANKKLVNLYYKIGKMLEKNSSWGNKFIDNVAMDLKMSFPNLKGFSVRNIKYMKTFYNEYKDDAEFVQLVAQLPWKHNITLMKKVKDKEIRKWYINKPVGVSEYKIFDQLNKEIQSKLPTKEEINLLVDIED